VSDTHVSSDRNRRDDLPVRSGTLLAIGAASRTGARENLITAIADLDELAIPVPAAPDIDIQNMVVTADFATSLNLPTGGGALGLNRTEYEPEQHPALIYRPDEPAIVLLVVSSGKSSLLTRQYLHRLKQLLRRSRSNSPISASERTENGGRLNNIIFDMTVVAFVHCVRIDGIQSAMFAHVTLRCVYCRFSRTMAISWPSLAGRPFIHDPRIDPNDHYVSHYRDRAIHYRTETYLLC
jgi:hypothetical protein